MFFFTQHIGKIGNLANKTQNISEIKITDKIQKYFRVSMPQRNI